jgi:hypothetical protein
LEIKMEELWDDQAGIGDEVEELEAEKLEESEESEEVAEVAELEKPERRFETRAGDVPRNKAASAVLPGTVPVDATHHRDATPTSPAPEPRLIPIRDKHYAFGRAASFAEFVAQSSHYGTLLRNRYAETRLPPDQQAWMMRYPDTLCVLALVTEEDPDTLAVLPVVARLLDSSRRFDLRILRDDESLAALAVLLPELDLGAALEEWDLPQFLCFDEELDLVAQWGPRPATMEDPLEGWLRRHPEYETLAEDDSVEAQTSYADLVEELIYEMRVWYNSGAARACLDEWRDLLLGLLSAEDQAQLENEVA